MIISSTLGRHSKNARPYRWLKLSLPLLGKGCAYTEFLGQSRVALEEVLNSNQAVLSDAIRIEMADVLKQLTWLFIERANGQSLYMTLVSSKRTLASGSRGSNPEVRGTAGARANPGH